MEEQKGRTWNRRRWKLHMYVCVRACVYIYVSFPSVFQGEPSHAEDVSVCFRAKPVAVGPMEAHVSLAESNFNTNVLVLGECSRELSLV